MLSVEFEPRKEYGARHREVLWCATTLIAERGLSGASLRELARRVGMSQPSLYHYFESKDELVEQAVDWYATSLLARQSSVLTTTPFAQMSVEETFRFALKTIVSVWDGPAHVTFVRFMFAVTMERPQFGPWVRELLLDRGIALLRSLVLANLDAPEDEADEADEADAVEAALRIGMDAIVMRLIQQRILNFEDPTNEDLDSMIEMLVDVTLNGARGRAARRRAEDSQ